MLRKISKQYFFPNLLIGMVLSFAFFSVSLCQADEEINPEDLRVSTPIYKPNTARFDPPLGLYTYEVSWGGIPAAETTVSIEQNGLQYRVISTARTYRAIDLFYKLRYRAEGVLSAVDYQPSQLVIDHTENSRIKKIEINFHPDGVIEGTRSQVGKDTKSFHFNSSNFTLDPISAAFIARGLDWKLGETKEFDTFNGKSRYLIRLTAEERVQIKVNSVARDCWVIVPTVQNLTSPSSNSKLRKARIYLTADNAREILKISSEVFIGSVTTKLVAFTPSTSAANGTRVASLNGRVFVK